MEAAETHLPTAAVMPPREGRFALAMRGAAAGFWVAAAVILLYRLGDFPLKDFDEAIYAEVSREMLRTGDLLTLHYNHDPYFNKPPLYFWASALMVNALGFSEISSRLPGVLFGGLTLWATVGLGRALGGAVCGWASGALLLSTAMFLENGSRHASPDSLLLLLSVAALWAQWRSRRQSALRYVAVALLGLAFLTKSAAAIPLLVAMALIHGILRDDRAWTRGASARAALLVAALVVPWYVLQTVLHGSAFWQQHVGVMVWERATRVGFLHSRGSLYYTRFLIEQLTYLWPLGIVLLWRVVETRVRRRGGGLRELVRAHREAGVTLVLAVAVPVVLYSAARNHIWWYVLPAVPPLCVAGGLVLEAGRRMAHGVWRQGLFCVLLGLLLFNAIAQVRTTLTAQIRNGVVVYGAQAQLAKKVASHAESMGLTNPIVFFPRHSPSVAAYVPYRVVFDAMFDADYANNLNRGPLRILSQDGVFVIDKRRAIDRVRERAPTRILEEHEGWALIVAGREK